MDNWDDEAKLSIHNGFKENEKNDSEYYCEREVQ